MSAAERLPAAIALMTVAPPVTISPPAHTPSLEVLPFSSALMVPYLVVSKPGVFIGIKGFGLVPRAKIATSTSMMCSDPILGTGRLLPLASGSPSSISMHSTALSLPRSSPMNLTGVVRNLKIMPSSLAFSISSLLAGISFSERL